MGFTSPGLWLVLGNELLQWPHGLVPMGRKRDLKNVHAKRPPSYNPEDSDDLNEWGEELARMTDRRRQHNERHKPGKSA
ncbi:MAG TPA: hypothetical protein DEA66_08080 [Flavobacteriales bacterium]|nr:hypothetical protein [Flavobacteriales bacterium]